MDLPQIGYFIVLSRVLNFTHAARECRVTQPAFSRSIKRLEWELGGDLLLRERSLTQLTEFGRSMLPLLEQVKAAADLARDEARHLQSRDSAPLRLGLSPWLAFPLIGAILSEVITSIRSMEFTIAVEAETVMRERMLRGELDVFVGLQADTLPERFNQWHLFSTGASVFLPQNHRLACEESIISTNLAEATLLGASEPEALPERILSQIARRVGRRPSTPHRAGNWETSLQLVRTGLGLGLGLSCWPTPAELVARALSEPVVEYDVVVETLAGRPQSRAATAFVKLARASAWTYAPDVP
jgi:LysR family transcriptional regulator, hydrogen peroxide-inducible genes activator